MQQSILPYPAKFINISNHPSSRWSKKQLDAALAMCDGEIIDIQFPNIDPNMFTMDVDVMAHNLIEEIVDMYGTKIIVLIQGEPTFVYRFLIHAKKHDIICVAATSQRNTVENEDGSKTVRFEFVQFRLYDLV